MEGKLDSLHKIFKDELEKKPDESKEMEVPIQCAKVPTHIFPATAIHQFRINEDLLSVNADISPVCHIIHYFYNPRLKNSMPAFSPTWVI